MSNKLSKKKLAAIDEQKKQKKRNMIIAAASAIAVIAVIAVVYSLSARNRFSPGINADGNVVIPMSEVHNDFHQFDFGGSVELLVWREQEGVYHTAFNTCEECYASGQASYRYQNGTLTCGFCGNVMNVSGMGNDAWGGCQPVAIPDQYRQDSDTEIVIPGAVLQYADNMFARWDEGDFSITLETYQP